MTASSRSKRLVSAIFFLSFGLATVVSAQTSASYTGADTTTIGNWTGKFGADGQLIPNDLSNAPTYATVSLTGNSVWTWANGTSDTRGLQTYSGSSSRIASTYYGTSFTVDLNLTDGNAHKISFYLCDWDTTSRAESISIVDAVSHAVLSTQTFSAFSSGVYETWSIKGHVQIQIMYKGGINALVNGIFFDTPGSTTTAASATYVGADTTTVGNWTGKYGSDGQFIANDLAIAPAYAGVSLTGDLTWTWAQPTSDPRALQQSSGSTSRIASTYYSASSFTIDVNLTDANAHKVSLYLLDWENAKRAETISIVDAASQAQLSTQSFSSFSGGVYETWSVKGHVQIKVVFTGGNNAAVAGVFFDTGSAAAPSATATYTGADNTTIGNWTGKFGADGQIIPNDLTKSPAYSTVSLTGDQLWTWASPTSDPRGLQTASGSSTRIASTYYSNAFTIDLNLTDGNSHKISLYLCDWDSGNRAETVSIIDAGTHAVLSSQSFSSFVGGVYESWTIKGHVQMQVIYQSGFNAIVNGIFFDTPSTTSPAPTVTLTANPPSITAGGGSTLTWSSTNATSCTASGGWTGTQPTSGSTSVSPSATTSYTLSCTGPGGSAQASATVTVTAALAADWVYYNGQFNWPADWSYGATINYSSTAGAPLSGLYDIQVNTSTWGGWQPAAPNQALDLTPYKYVTFSLKPTIASQAWSCYFTKTGSSTISTVVNVLNYGPAPVAGVWGTYSIPLADLGVSASSIASFAVQDQTGLASNSWYIDNVGFVQSVPPFYPPLVTLTASPTLFTSAGNTTLTWSSTNATSCLASGGWSGSLSTTGTKSVAVANSTSYVLTCTGAGGSASANANVTVSNPSAFSIQVSGNRLVNGTGKTVQLRGVNLSGMEFAAVGGWDPSDPTGGQFGQPNNPNWTAIQNWKANVVRIPLNEDSWLGLTCTDTDGVVRNSDPGANYKQTVANLVKEANAAGIYVILDLHWAAPGNTCPMLQSQMADTDHSLAFWTSIANTYKGNPAVLFELFNEPFLDFDFSGDPWQYLMYGTGGSFSGYPATSLNGTWKNVTTPWNIASYQAMINAVRATGATNVVLIGSLSYTADLSGWLSHKPSDPLGQMAATWHPYPGGSTWGTPAWAQPSYAPQIFTEVQSILAAGIPVVATETGDQNTTGTVGAPLVQTVTTFADANGVSLLGWTWDVWTEPDFVLIKDVNGTPTDGYGVFFKAWMVNHP